MSSIVPINVDDYRILAQRRLPTAVFDYLDGGAEDELGLEHNRMIFRRLRLKPRRLVNVSRRDMTVSLFGRQQPAPLIVGPTGFNGIFWYQGDLALARAAASVGIPFTLSTASNESIENIARHSKGDLWFQLYVVQRDLTERLVRRAEASGYRVLVLTTDVSINGKRERDLRNRLRLPMRYTPRLALQALGRLRWSLHVLRHGMPRLANFDGADVVLQAALSTRQIDTSFDWNELAWLRRIWPHRLLVKGIMHPDDAVRCVALGVDGVFLSNHGGRQLDSCVSPLEVLVETRQRTTAPILIDGGFRRGSDIVKALALGADGVVLGRAMLYGLAAAGETGARHVLTLLIEEMDCTLAQIGCRSISELSPEHLAELAPLCQLQVCHPA